MSDPGTPNPPAPAPDDAESRDRIFVNEMLGRKDFVGAEARKFARTRFPGAAGIPAEDPETAVAPLKAEVGDLKSQLKTAMEKIAAREKADDDLKVENELSRKLSNARREFGLTDAGYDKMVTRMNETGNYADADAAAAWVVSQTPKPTPSNTPSWLPEPANMFGALDKDAQFEALHKDPRKYMDDQLREFARDPDKYVAETFGTA